MSKIVRYIVGFLFVIVVAVLFYTLAFFCGYGLGHLVQYLSGKSEIFGVSDIPSLFGILAVITTMIVDAIKRGKRA